jgi:hypothetical protein
MRAGFLGSSLALTGLLAGLLGCSTKVNDIDGTGSSGSGTGSSTGSSTGTGTTSGSSSSSSGDFDAGGAVTTYTTGMGPIALMPGEEQTNCIVVPLGNAEGGFVRRFRADLDPGSHHMIVYTAGNETPNSTPTPCVGLSGILTGDHPVFIAQQPTAELVYPTDENDVPVGFEIGANQLLKIEFHTINTTTSPLMVNGKAYMDTVPLSTKVTQSNIAFWGTENIHIPPNGSYDTGVLFQAAIPGTHSFALTTHQHHLGTEMQIWYSAEQGDMSDRVADGTNWANPPLVMPAPALDFPMGGTKGLSFECHWVNPTANEVNFGESYYDEMCFLWHYYYPSSGFQLCIDGHCG